MAATLALVIGTFAGFALSRFPRFPGRLVFGFTLMAPLAVPQVIGAVAVVALRGGPAGSAGRGGGSRR